MGSEMCIRDRLLLVSTQDPKSTCCMCVCGVCEVCGEYCWKWTYVLNAHPRLASARLLVPPAAAGCASRRGRIRSRTPRTAAPPPRRALAAHNQVHKQDPCHVAIGRKPKGQIALERKMRQISRQDPESTCSCCGLSTTNSKTVRRNTHTHMTDQVIEGANREQ